jgi:hypothetical protein
LSGTFDDYPIYVIPERNEDSKSTENIQLSEEVQTNFVVFTTKLVSIPEKQKLQQILRSVKLSEESYTVLETDENPSIIDNVLSNKKITQIIIFGDHPALHFVPLNRAHTEGHQQLFRTSSIIELIIEEKAGYTILRKALWLGLKKWLLS